MTTKTLTITFSEYKQIRKSYLSLINYCQSLTQLDHSHGATSVLTELETRYKSHTATNEDIATLRYIVDNYDCLRYRLTWY